MFPVEWHPWLAAGIVAIVFAGIQFRRGTPPDVWFLFGLVVLVISGVLSPKDALAGFANPAVLTVAALLAVTAGLRSTGLLDWIGHKLLGGLRTEDQAILRLTITLIPVSAVMLNTALVAMLMPVLIEWCRRNSVSPSRLLIPLSFLSVLGGVCSLVGTSTNIVVNGMYRTEYETQLAKIEKIEQQIELGSVPPIAPEALAAKKTFAHEVRPMSMFEIGWVGVPCALVGGAYLFFVGRKLLPNRTEMLEQLGEQRREYLVEMLVTPECTLIGQTVEKAGLRHLPGLFLIEIDRHGDQITPVTPDDVIRDGDRLIFTGVVSTIVDLEKIPGLVPAADTTYEFHPSTKQQRALVEVVLSRSSPLVGVTVRAANFREQYNAAVVAVHRNGARLTNKIGSIRLESGDTLLLQTRHEFVNNYRNSKDFYLVSSVDDFEARRHDKALLAGALVLLLIAWLSLSDLIGENGIWAGLTSPAVATMGVAALMIATGCVRATDARNAIDLQVIVSIAASLCLGQALSKSGAAGWVAEQLTAQIGDHPYLLLVALYLLAIVFTEMMSNNAVAAMLFPLAVALAAAGGYSPRPFVMGITLAASLAFITPIGYQTNLMVMGPGGYRPADFLRVGLPLTALVTIAALVLIPLVWPF
ncbi:MAG TPA: SLC13 family permease [Pirellulaceae bacterium]|nr:SLC13 family permease [Pirellulaceae bacterium]